MELAEPLVLVGEEVGDRGVEVVPPGGISERGGSIGQDVLGLPFNTRSVTNFKSRRSKSRTYTLPGEFGMYGRSNIEVILDPGELPVRCH